MLTLSTEIFRCPLKLAQEVAEAAGLTNMVDERRGYGYVMWYDLETGGGACRIVWRNGITWVSHHGGYSRSIDITAEVSQLLREAGAIEFASGREPVCPYKCGTRDSDDSLARRDPDSARKRYDPGKDEWRLRGD